MIVNLAQIGNEVRLRNAPPTGITLVTKKIMALLLIKKLSKELL